MMTTVRTPNQIGSNPRAATAGKISREVQQYHGNDIHHAAEQGKEPHDTCQSPVQVQTSFWVTSLATSNGSRLAAIKYPRRPTPMRIINNRAVMLLVCSHARLIASHDIRRRTVIMMTEPTTPMPPPSVGLKIPTRIPPRIIIKRTSIPMTPLSDNSFSRQENASPGVPGRAG